MPPLRGLPLTRQIRGAQLLFVGVALLASAFLAALFVHQYEEALHERGSDLASLVLLQGKLLERLPLAGEVGEGARTQATVVEELGASLAHELLGAETGEFVVSEAVGKRARFLVHRYPIPEDRRDGDLVTQIPRPMQRALAGEYGYLVGPDYRGVTVLAAHAPVPRLGLGLVAKLDLAEVRRPYLKIAGYGIPLLLLLLVGGVHLSLRRITATLQRIASQDHRLRAAFEDGGVSTFLCDPHQGWILFDAGGLTTLGLEEEAHPRGRVEGWIDALVHPEDRARLRATVAREDLGPQEVCEVEFRLRSAGADFRWVRLRARRSEEVDSPRMIGTLVERQADQQALDEARLRGDVLDAVRQVHERLSEPGATRYAIAAALERLRELAGASGVLLLAPGAGAAPKLTLVAGDALEAEGPCRALCEAYLRAETEEITPDGGILLHPLRIGQELVGVLGLKGLREDTASLTADLHPLTELIGQAIARFNFEQQARDEASRRLLLETAVENLREAILITDAKGSILYANPMFTRLSGYTLEEVLGKSPNLLNGGDQPPAFYEELWRTIGAGRSWSGRFVNRRKGGETWTEEATISPIVGEEGAPEYFVKVARDITEDLEIERRLRGAERLASVATLTGGIAHEFNNILGIILGYSELLADEFSPESPTGKDVAKISEVAGRGAALVHQLLTFSRQNERAPSPPPPKPLVKETVRMLQGMIPSAVGVTLETCEGPATILGDAAQFQQLLVSLAQNAAEAYEGGTGTVRVVLEERPRDVVLEVHDQGCGIPEAVLERVREPFFTTHSERGASGLGLSVVHGIVEERGGTLQIESTPDEGTSVRITLPRAEPAAPGDDRPPSTPSLLKGRALVVDDEGAMLELLTRNLRQLGLEVVAFRDPRHAAEWLRDDPPPADLLVTDLAMPELDGSAIARLFRDRFPGRPILLQTGFGADQALKKPEAHQLFDRVLYKPVRRQELQLTVQELLEG